MTAGALTWCTDVSYPPGESYAADGTTPEGFDIDIAAEIARRWGVTSEVQPTGWDALLPTLRGNGCDLVISTMSSTFGDRAKQADFVDYLQPWTALMVAAGNPKGINTAEDLAGKSVAVERGVAPAAALRAASAELVAAGKPAIEIVTATQSDEKWVEQLVGGKVDALAGDSVHAAYHAPLPPYAGKAEVGGPAIDPQPIGIAIRKDDAGMKEAVAAAIDAIYADGTMKAIVEKWGIADAVELLK
jgi:polar amino acid transport system substrate-binding protein